MIHGIHGFLRPRLVRLGKIYLGEKTVSSKSGQEYPRDLDHFRVPPEVAEVHGDKPTALPVRVPSADIAEWFPYSLKRYSKDGKLWCRGDGQIARCYDETTGEWAERPCLYKECEHYQDRKCTEIGTLQVILPHVDMTGVYQINTGSWHAINNIHQEFTTLLDIMRAAIGPVADQAILHLTMMLTREEQTLEFAEEKGGKQMRRSTTKHLLHLRPPRMTLEMIEDLAARCRAPVAGYLTPGTAAGDDDYVPEPDDAAQADDGETIDGEVVPEPDESMPTDMYPNAAPEGPDMGVRSAWAALLEQVQALGKNVAAAEKSAIQSVNRDAAKFTDLTTEEADKALSRLTDMVERWQDEAGAAPEPEPEPVGGGADEEGSFTF